MFDVSLQNTATGFDIQLSFSAPPAGLVFSIGGAGVGVARINGSGGVATINGTI